MIYIECSKIPEYIKKYPGLSLSPDLCPDCGKEDWNDAVFELWIDVRYVGIDRLCACGKKQSCITHKNKKDSFNFA